MGSDPFRRVSRSSLTPERLAEGAVRAIGRYGWQGATLERIAEETGVSRVTLHRHGVTREGLLADLSQRALADYRESMWPALTGSGSGVERLERALQILCEVTERNLELLTALGAQTDNVFHEDGDEALTRTEFTEPLERLLRDGNADGSLREVDPVETATVLFNLVGWTYAHLRTGHRWAEARARDATLAVALHGVSR